MFRFENLEIWKKSIEIAERLFDLADDLDRKKLFKFAGQLRGAALFISNNIAEGSGSNSKKEFIQFLNISKRSCFENANMIIVFEKRRYVQTQFKQTILSEIEDLCRMISSLIKTLRS
jgi:four helix bundle protein